MAGDGDEALLVYGMDTAPFGTLRAAEHLVLHDGRIARSRLVFDTHAVRGAQNAV